MRTFLALFLVFAALPLMAQTEEAEAPNALAAAYSFEHGGDPYDFAFLSYQRWCNPTDRFESLPEQLRLKVEFNLGAKVDGKDQLYASVVPLLVYYVDFLTTDNLRPYLDAGVGVSYTDFIKPGHGTRWNFTPQAGLGLEMGDRSAPWFTELRWHHMSNASLNDDNSGFDHVVVMLGKRF